MTETEHQKHLMGFWLHWFSHEVLVRQEETPLQAHDRMARAMSAFVDEDPLGLAMQSLENFVVGHETEFTALLQSAYRKVCARASGSLGARHLKARLLFIPLVVRSAAGFDAPLEIDAYAGAALQEDLNDRLAKEGRSQDCIIPVSELFSSGQIDITRPANYYAMLRQAMVVMGVAPGNPMAIIDQANQQVNFTGSGDLMDLAPSLLCWPERKQAEDPSVFIDYMEGAPAQLTDQQLTPVIQRTVCGRQLCLIWICDEGAKLPMVFSDPEWRNRASELLTQYLNCAQEDKPSIRPETVSPSVAEIELQNAHAGARAESFSLSVVGCFEPAIADLKLRQELLFQRVLSAARFRLAIVESARAEGAVKDPDASIVYDPAKELLMLVLDGDFRNPDITLKVPNTAWLYPFMARIATELQSAGCDRIHTNVMDHTLQSPGDLAFFARVH